MTPPDRGAGERRSVVLLLGTILVAALLLRVVPLTYSHFWDETVYLQHARVIVDGRSNYDEFDYKPPLLPILYAAGYKVWDHIYVANIVQGVASGLAVLFAFLCARQAFGSAAGLIAAALFAFVPYFVAISHDLLTDMPAVTLMLAAIWLYHRGGAPSAFWAGVAAALAVQTRFTSLFIFAYFAVDAVFSGWAFRRLCWLAAGALVAMAPYLIWVWWNYGSVFHPFVQASRITTEWTAHDPAGFYFTAMLKIFPSSVLLLFACGVAAVLMANWRHISSNPGGHPPRRLASLDVGTARALALLGWGAAFFAYMVSIPHKEVRYLLPLAIPIVIVGAFGAAALGRWVGRQAIPYRVAAAIGVGILAAAEFAPAFARLGQPWIDAREWPIIEIARYINEVSTPDDVLYAAHEFPVLAFYSERTTRSLLPIQDDFDAAWRRWMARPGYVVYYRPSRIGETHARHPAFKPDPAFMSAHPSFKAIREFPDAVVYRYDPKLE